MRTQISENGKRVQASLDSTTKKMEAEENDTTKVVKTLFSDNSHNSRDGMEDKTTCHAPLGRPVKEHMWYINHASTCVVE